MRACFWASVIPTLLFFIKLSWGCGLPPFVGICWLDMLTVGCSSLGMVI